MILKAQLYIDYCKVITFLYNKTGLFRYAIIHSGSPLAYWHMSDCAEIRRLSSVSRDCKEGTSRTTKKVRKKIGKLINHSSIDDFMSSIYLGEVTSYCVRCNVCIVILARQLHIDNCLWWMMAEWHPYHQFISVTRYFIWLKNRSETIKSSLGVFPRMPCNSTYIWSLFGTFLACVQVHSFQYVYILQIFWSEGL